MSVLEKPKAKSQEPEVLDPITLAALEEGLKMAEADSRRWTPAQVREDARTMAKEWRQKITRPNNE